MAVGLIQLSSKRNVVISDFRGKALVSIREFYEKDGKQLPAAKGERCTYCYTSSSLVLIILFAFVVFAC